jgi:D-proline reductase (dithiol) PrdB
MGHIGEFSISLQVFLKAYPWRRIDPVPWTPLRKPLVKSRLALVSTAGFIMPGQQPFDGSLRGGDMSFREIPGNAKVAELVDTHRSKSFDHTGMCQDPNLALPLDRIRELVESGRIGALADKHLSLMGAISQPGELIRSSAPKAAEILVRDEVDVALLVPV